MEEAIVDSALDAWEIIGCKSSSRDSPEQSLTVDLQEVIVSSVIISTGMMFAVAEKKRKSRHKSATCLSKPT